MGEARVEEMGEVARLAQIDGLSEPLRCRFMVVGDEVEKAPDLVGGCGIRIQPQGLFQQGQGGLRPSAVDEKSRAKRSQLAASLR